MDPSSTHTTVQALKTSQVAFSDVKWQALYIGYCEYAVINSHPQKMEQLFLCWFVYDCRSILYSLLGGPCDGMYTRFAQFLWACLPLQSLSLSLCLELVGFQSPLFSDASRKWRLLTCTCEYLMNLMNLANYIRGSAIWQRYHCLMVIDFSGWTKKSRNQARPMGPVIAAASVRRRLRGSQWFWGLFRTSWGDTSGY